MKIFILIVAALIVVVMSCGFLLPEGAKEKNDLGIAKKGAEIVDAAAETVKEARKPKRKSKAAKLMDKYHDPKKSKAAKMFDEWK